MSDLRKQLIRLASNMPTGPERRDLLAVLSKHQSKTALRLEGSDEVIMLMQPLLRREMTVVNQYMVQHAWCDNQGYTKLSAHFKAQAISEMRHAEALIERTIFLEGIPEVGQLNEVKIGSNVPEMFANNLDSEQEAVQMYNSAVARCLLLGDNGTRTLLEGILADEEKHHDNTQAMLEQIDAMGLDLFLSEQTG